MLTCFINGLTAHELSEKKSRGHKLKLRVMKNSEIFMDTHINNDGFTYTYLLTILVYNENLC